MREGEVLLSDLWILLHKKRIVQIDNIADETTIADADVLARYPLPADIDFRMVV